MKIDGCAEKHYKKCVHGDKVLYAGELRRLDLFILTRRRLGSVQITACQHKTITYRGTLNLAEKGLRRIRGWKAKLETFKLTGRCDFIRLRLPNQ